MGRPSSRADAAAFPTAAALQAFTAMQGKTRDPTELYQNGVDSRGSKPRGIMMDLKRSPRGIPQDTPGDTTIYGFLLPFSDPPKTPG